MKIKKYAFSCATADIVVPVEHPEGAWCRAEDIPIDTALICECGDHISEGLLHSHRDGKTYCELCTE